MAHGVEIAIIAQNYADKILKGIGNEVRAAANIINKAVLATTVTTKVVAKSMSIMAKASFKVVKGMRSFAASSRAAAKNSRSLSADMKKMNGVAKASVQSMGNLASKVKKLVVAYVGFRALRGMLASFTKFADAFNTQTAAVNGLAKALQLSGEFSEKSMESHKAFAAQMQAGANVGDEVTLGLMKQASMLGVSDDELQNVTKTAIGLSEATGIELNTALKRTVGAMSGVYGELGEVIPSVRQATTEQAKLAAVTEIAAKGFEQKKSSIDSLRGIMTKARNTVGDLMEKVGELLSPILKVVYEGFHVLSLAIMDSIDDVIEMGGGLENIEKVARSFVQEIVRRFLAMHAAVQVVFKNFGKVVEMAMAFGKLKVLNFVGDVTHFFTVNLPEVFAWLGRNAFNLLKDAFNAIITITVNLMKKIGKVIMAGWEFITSGFDGGFAALGQSLGEAIGGGLMDGFESSLEPLPELAERQLTETEKALQGQVSSIAGSLKGEFDELLQERLALLEDADTDAGGLDPLKRKGKGGLGAGKAGEVGAFESRLLTRGPSARKTVEELLEELVRNTEKTAKNTENIASPTDGEDPTEINIEIINGGQ